ncbi:MAG TPA: N-formylglutamate deformylase [Propylenella sp.]|nr:N-formylglutamate deformylase [Propylenella sp.]
MAEFLEVTRGSAPLLVSIPHTGTDLPADIEADLVSPWLARKDTDWWIEKLYRFAPSMGATVLRTKISRTVIDANRDPSGASLYPGQATTGLCPTETFDGEPLYRAGREPDEAEIARRRALYFLPYHEALSAEIERLRQMHPRIVLYDCHSIRSVVPRLFDGELPHINIGTNSGHSCEPALQQAIEAVCAASPFSWVSNGRFKGGWITRRYGRPQDGVHAVQMELACRTYMDEPGGPLDVGNWPGEFDGGYAASARGILADVLGECLTFAQSDPSSGARA